MEPLFRNLVVGLVPQPKQVPPAPFPKEDLQRAFFEVSRVYQYQQFGFMPADGGAEMGNSPEDSVSIQPGLLQLRSPIDLTAAAAREKATSILGTIAKRLEITGFIQGGIKVVAHVPTPGEGGAKQFIADRLMHNGEQVVELGPGFFAGGVKFRSIEKGGLQEAVLLIEPWVKDDKYLFIDYDVQRREAVEDQGIEAVTAWLDEAFDFVSGPTMDVLGGLK